MAMMTLRRLSALHARAVRPTSNRTDLAVLARALAQRTNERGPSKLARRLYRKHELGRAGAF